MTLEANTPIPPEPRRQRVPAVKPWGRETASALPSALTRVRLLLCMTQRFLSPSQVMSSALSERVRDRVCVPLASRRTRSFSAASQTESGPAATRA